MFKQYPDVLALMSGFAAHDRSFITKIQKKTSGTKGNLVWFLLHRKIQWSKISNLASTRITNATWMLDDSMKSVRHERQSGRFSKSRGLSASVSFLPLPLPSLFSCGNPLPLTPTETLATQATGDQHKFPGSKCQKHAQMQITLDWKSMWCPPNCAVIFLGFYMRCQLVLFITNIIMLFNG